MFWLLIPLAYLLGSLSPAWLAGRITGKDLRLHGSGNLGATNAGRVLGGRWFAFVFAGDVLKGLVPVVVAWRVPMDSDQRGLFLVATAAAAVLGHAFTCFHGFKGGKAVATSLGVVAGIAPLVAAAILPIWLATWGFSQWRWKLARSAAVGPASMLAALVTPGLRLTLCAEPWSAVETPITAFLILLSVLVLVKHRTNFTSFLELRKRAAR